MDNYYDGYNDDYDYDQDGETGLLTRSEADTVVLSNTAQTERLGSIAGYLVRLNTGASYMLMNNSNLLMGRCYENVQIYVDNNCSVSSRHVQVCCDRGICTVVDLVSTNGTFINERRLTPGIPERLNYGDYLTLGNEIFRFRQQ